MELCSIASGSSGNCLCVGTDNCHLLIDAGVSGKRIEAGLNSVGLKTEEMQGILVTHEHMDHIQGLGVLARRYGLPMYATAGTIEAILATKAVGKIDVGLFHEVEHMDHIQGLGVLARRYGLPMYATAGTIEAILATKAVGKIDVGLFHEVRAEVDFTIGDLTIEPIAISHDAAEPVAYKFRQGDKTLAVMTDLGTYDEREVDFTIGDLTIEPIAISHDAAEPVAYKFRQGDKTLAVMTDLGTYDERIVEKLKAMDVLFLESNHDVHMLQAGAYPYSLKQRILGEKGHLSNELCGKLLHDVHMLQAGAYPYSLKQRILGEKGHLSNELCGKLLGEVLHDGLKAVFLGHLSKENNYPQLAYETVRVEITLGENPYSGDDFPLYVAGRSEASEILGHLSKENNYPQLAYETVRVEITLGENPYSGDDFPLYVAGRSEASEIMRF